MATDPAIRDTVRLKNVFLPALAMLVSIAGQTLASDGIAFFESRIRPVLIERCYECHNTAETAEAGLALDWKEGIRATSDHGPVVVPGKPEESLLLKVMRHEIADLEMPEGGPKLDRSVVDDFTRWISMGAPDPRNAPPSAEELSQSTSWETVLARRKQWWSLQPIQDPQPPAIAGADHPVDQFIRAKLADEALQPAERADRVTLIRRLSYVLTGLPPTVEDIDRFLANDAENAWEQLIDEYLGSAPFGERWARHWMDLVRYTDSHGSEGDPEIPNAYRYRDYLIRALNADVPYDQLVLEHLAGDVLPNPRHNETLGINESAVGPAHLRFVFHGFAPTDALDEKVRFTDDQINVFSKTFLALTVSCARCHDHKFDAISQQDYYALFGIFASCRPALRDVNLPELRQKNSREIADRKLALRTLLADAWLASLDDLTRRLTHPDADLQAMVDETEQPGQLLHVLKRIADRGEHESIADAWHSLREQWQAEREPQDQAQDQRRWDLSTAKDYDDWFAYGNGLPERPTPPGEFAVNAEGPVVQGVFPAGIVTHSISQQHRGFLTSRRFELDRAYDAWMLVAGGGQPSLRYVVENYPRDGTVYPIPTINKDHFHWQQLKLKYWTGDFIHFELATSQDAPLRNRNRDRSWFAVREVLLRNSGDPPPPPAQLEYLSPVFQHVRTTPTTRQEVVASICAALQRALTQWRSGDLNDAQALLINACLPLLPNDVESLPAAGSEIETIRSLQAEIPEPTRVPGVVEADAFDQPLFARGNHRQPMDPVKRRFLEALDRSPYQTDRSGRLELAKSVLHPDNPLTARVIVNRIWYYLFGRGIVATPDNFGQLGEQPTHPELLDYLATRIKNRGWSVKDTIRFLLTSQTWQASSAPTTAARERDPDNRLLSHANVMRLDAESIRDTLLAVSGQLDRRMFGPGFQTNSDARRRSVYVSSRRNSLDDFLQTFDAPVPFATVGRRDITNVPAQSLTLINDPLVITLARQWADADLEGEPLDSQVAAMFRKALGRRPSHAERSALVTYVQNIRSEIQAQDARRVQLEQTIEQVESSIEEILRPARQLVASSDRSTLTPQPVAAWDFEQGYEDQVGPLHGTPHGNAQVADGRLLLDGGSHVATSPLQIDLSEKTLEAVVQLATLDQRGGGVITVQSTDGTRFDSIVYGEMSPQHWIAGSDYFKRTANLNGKPETEALQQATHVAITYASDGTIRFYRNGMPYGNPTRKGELQNFDKAESQVLFGLRHGDAQGGMLRGQIFSAKLYDRALTPEEVAACAGVASISEAQLLAAVPEDQRTKLAELRRQVRKSQTELDALPARGGPNEALARLAHAIFNLKEFIYLR